MFPRDLVHHARHAFNYHTRPGLANTEATTVTDDSSTAMHTSTDSERTASPTSTVTDADNPRAVVLYPTGQPTINNIDTVEVTYDTIWGNAKFTLFCAIDEGANEWALAEIKLAQPNGTYTISPIQAGMKIPQFPVYCGMLLYNAMNVSDSTTGGGFTMTSTMGAVSTYAMTVTTAMSSSTTGSSISTTTGSSTGSMTGSRSESAPTSRLTATPLVSSSTASETGVSAASSSTALSAGAKAGIAIGIILGAIALLAATFFFFRLRKRINRVEDMVKLGSTASPEREPSSEKPVTPMPGGTTRLTSPAVFAMGGNLNRNSEDWRRFFGSASNPRSQTPTST